MNDIHRQCTLDFIEKANKVHDTYDYSLVKYINQSHKIIIICKEHGKFLQTPNHHLAGSGCPVCFHTKSGLLKSKKSAAAFINQAKLVHTNKYDYSNVDYITSKTNIIIICNKHGKFLQTPNNHLKGQDCPKCANSNRYKNWLLVYENNKQLGSLPDILYLLRFTHKQKKVQFQKHKLKDKLTLFNPDLTETENMYNNGYRKIYDSGNKVYIRDY